MSDDQIDKLTDNVADKLAAFMEKLVKETNVCPMCMHSLIMLMCQKFMEEGNAENDVKH
jgi:hypothetical protein